MVSCSVGHRRGSDPALLWRRLAATAPFRPLAWDPPYATRAALEKAKRQIKIKIKNKNNKQKLKQIMAKKSRFRVPGGRGHGGKGEGVGRLGILEVF